jgi:UV DNA damage endonuclease
MIEAKDKEQAVFHLFRRYGLKPVFHGKLSGFSCFRLDEKAQPDSQSTLLIDSLRPPALEETTQTAGRKSNKKKTPKKGVKDEDEDTATDGTAPSSPLNGNDLEEIKKEDNMLEHGVAPLPEGINAEGQTVVKVEEGETVKGKGKGKGKANGKAASTTTTPKKKAATPRKRKVKEEDTDGNEDGENGIGDEKAKPAKKARSTPKAKKVAETNVTPAIDVPAVDGKMEQ